MTPHEQIARWLAEARSAVVFTGAGMSTESGIPDFRSPGGIWATSQPVYFNDFLASAEASARVLTDAGAVKAYIVSVGGFLGIGRRYVAIVPKAVALKRQDERNWKATINANKDQLRAAPEYKWELKWRKP